jgi:Na+/H+ antiporter NhaD/arsenite permease-like protein
LEAGVTVIGIPVEFFIFAATLLGVAFFHKHALPVSIAGVVATIAFKLSFSGFVDGPGWVGLAAHFGREWVVLANLLLLLTGFALMSAHFEHSKLPDRIPAWLPDNWTGGLVLLGIVFCLSAVLDNIAAAVIGGVVARHVYRGDVCVGYLAAIVAAANAGGAGSVIGDTTTTMMWLHGVSPLVLLGAFVAAIPAFLAFAIPAALIQQRYCSPIRAHAVEPIAVDWTRVAIVGVVLVCLVSANVGANAFFPGSEELLPVLGLAIWAALLATAFLRKPDWKAAPEAIKGAVFLVCLVATASLMPVESLPAASWPTALGLGFLSSVFDNIPLTALALKQGGYDWSILAYAVGFGGSMVWFGSSAGVALTNLYPQGRSVVRWLKQGWPVLVAYPVGFFVMLLMLGWHPTPIH